MRRIIPNSVAREGRFGALTWRTTEIVPVIDLINVVCGEGNLCNTPLR